MRIIGGEHRSRKILSPEGKDTTRPITDRVKQSLFDRLAVRGYIDNGAIVDLFAGTGSLGLEALSRGVDHCTFVEKDCSARERLIRNIADLKLIEQSGVLAGDALAGAWIDQLPHTPVSLVFCDPPYPMTSNAKTMARIADLIRRIADVAEPDAVLMLRTDDHTQAPTVASWRPPEAIGYGSMIVHWYDRA